ncbi:hypothetical protein [Chamaesiphon sp. VAR_48_metabat_135_sub]|nr:hypothetical protein [Chamaesiphon sp. VAR_48_metabat_135_sub]
MNKTRPTPPALNNDSQPSPQKCICDDRLDANMAVIGGLGRFCLDVVIIR